MNTNMKREVEVKGATVEAAIEAGLQQLGVARSDVIIDVIDEGSKGLLGLGVRSAVVRLVSMVPVPSEPEVVQSKPDTAVSPKPVTPKATTQPAKPTPPPVQKAKPQTITNPDVVITEPDEAERDVVVEVVQDLLKNMHVEATIQTSISEPDDVTGEKINIIEIHGDDLGVLIGPRGETLNSMQYITRLIVGHRLQQRTSFVLDIEGYRQRREQALTRLAERMADKVVKRGRPVSLEPMPPHERRIIHMTLRDNSAVQTKSVGEGKQRKVRILPN